GQVSDSIPTLEAIQQTTEFEITQQLPAQMQSYTEQTIVPAIGALAQAAVAGDLTALNDQITLAYTAALAQVRDSIPTLEAIQQTTKFEITQQLPAQMQSYTEQTIVPAIGSLAQAAVAGDLTALNDQITLAYTAALAQVT
ncbi:hypothetical protein CWB96_22805, partial [Pseudoalteromonas citrea]